jgi:hypothetical protein
LPVRRAPQELGVDAPNRWGVLHRHGDDDVLLHRLWAGNPESVGAGGKSCAGDDGFRPDLPP